LPQRIEELLTDDLSGSGPQPADRDEARVWFYALAELALADGALSKAERGFLTHAAAGMGIAYRDSEAALQAAHAKLYAASREARRSSASRA
jgi:hypothetical protein